MKRYVKDLDQLVKASQDVTLDQFSELVTDVTEMLANENSSVGSLRIKGRLVELPSEGESVVVGDLHGDLDSLIGILRVSNFIKKAQCGKKVFLVFLGDYGDRGMYSSEVYYVVLALKEAYQENVVLMRGNHEGPDDLLAVPHDLPFQLRSRFGEGGTIAYMKLKELFGQLYVAVILRDRYVFLHGGVPSDAKSLDDVAFAHLKHPKESHLEQILWSDPEEDIAGTYASPRGAGRLFGSDVTERFLTMLGVHVLVRGHEPENEGFRINHGGRVLTLFSRKGEPYFNSRCAFLQFALSIQIDDALQLVPFVRQL